MDARTFRQKCRYKFDNFMSRGGQSIFISLVVVFVVLLLMISLLRGISYWLLPADAFQYHPEEEMSFFRHVYIIFLQMTDPGNMFQDTFSSPWYKISAVLAGLTGVVMLSALIAFITTALDRLLNDLRKGHSKVIEEDHTLILGWNEQRVIEILRELLMANESEDDPSVVILSDADKEDMDDFLSVHMPDTQNTRVVTRSGAVSSLINLNIVSVDTCKSVILLASCHDSESDRAKAASDAKVIKTLLAISASQPPEKELNIVAEIFDPRNRQIAQDIREVAIVDTKDILAKILVQTSRSVGLSVVYAEVLSFDGCELYFHHDDWGDITFGDLCMRFPDGVPMGLRRSSGALLLNPPVDTKLAPDDDILILAEDDSTIEFRAEPVAESTDMPLAGGKVEQRVERELILGWTTKTRIILQEYADYVLDGSAVDIMLPNPPEEVREEVRALQEELTTMRIGLIDKDPLKADDLLSVEPFRYDNIIILSQTGEDGDTERADSETIVILLLLRKIFADHPEESASTKLITEVLDSVNQDLVSHAGVHDFIISNRYVSMLLAQISESGDIKKVYDDLFEESGSEIYVKPAHLYFESFPADVTFTDMMRIAQKRGEVCLGVKIKAKERDKDANFGVKLIPEKKTRYTLGPNDMLVVLSEDET